MYKRVDNLGKTCAEGTLDATGVAEYNKLDGCITEAMLAAEKRLPQRWEHG